jgi:hypothetical protein
MSSLRKSGEPVSAATLVAQLAKDPEHLQKMQTQQDARNEVSRQHRLAVTPIIDDLKGAGFSVESLDELRRSGVRYKAAIPILLKWLPLVVELGAKDSVVRALSVPWAKPIAAIPLIAEFEKQPEGMSLLKWAIGNALSVVADNSVAHDLFALAQDKSHGKAREMIVVALGNLSDPRTFEVLTRLLEDDEVCGHAIIAIANLKARQAVPTIRRFTNHPKAWVRKEAERAIAELTR